MPPANSDRWDQLLALGKDSVTIKLLTSAMGEASGQQLQAVAAETAGDRDRIAKQAIRLAYVGVTAGAETSLNDRYHTSQFNADILCGILFSDFLKRNPRPLYADPRLTAKKLWRDVYHYHKKNGKPPGWTRYRNGKQSEFTAAGDLLLSRKPDGSPGETAKVRYQFNPQTKSLETVVAE